MKATLTAMKKSHTKCFHSHTVPFAIKEAIARENERLEAAGVLEKVEFSQWVTSIVPVPKKDGSVTPNLVPPKMAPLEPKQQPNWFPQEPIWLLELAPLTILVPPLKLGAYMCVCVYKVRIIRTHK